MNRADLSIGIVATAPSPATSGTTLVLQSGQGADMPAVPFKALLCPPGQLATRHNSERVLVTNRSDDTLTITRAQGVTSAKTIEAGWLLSNNIFADDFVGSVSVVKKETPSGAVNGSNVTFTTANPYIGGTLQVFVNGLAQSNFVTETVPSTGTFTLDEAPLTGDNVRVEYSFTSTSYGNADTVDGYNANATPTANTIPVLDSNGFMPGASVQNKTIRIRNINGTASTISTAKTQKGSGYGQGNGTNIVDVAVTFPDPYTTVHHVAGGSLGIRSGSAPTTLAQINAGYSGNIVLCQPYNITNTGFTMRLTLDSSATLANTIYAGFWWESEGV